MKSVIFVTELDSSIAVEQRKVPKKYFSWKKHFFLRNKNMSHIVSDIAAGVAALWGSSKPSKFMIFGLLQKNAASTRHRAGEGTELRILK